jgi:acyl-CoA hydrolase
MPNNRAMAINNITQLDLQGQAASKSDGHRHISGTGGQLQFIRGDSASKGGRSFHLFDEKRGVRRSRIERNLSPGNIATVPRSNMMSVVTAYGIVSLKGKSYPARELLTLPCRAAAEAV